jgi:hypothetical protein
VLGIPASCCDDAPLDDVSSSSCVICGAGAPVKSKLFLADAAILQPMKTHIHGFGTFWLDSFVDDAFGG